MDSGKRTHSNRFGDVLELFGINLEKLEIVGLSEDLEFGKQHLTGPAPPTR